MSLKHYDYRKPHLTSAFEILEADFEMQEEDEYQRYYKHWHNDPYSYIQMIDPCYSIDEVEIAFFKYVNDLKVKMKVFQIKQIGAD